MSLCREVFDRIFPNIEDYFDQLFVCKFEELNKIKILIKKLYKTVKLEFMLDILIRCLYGDGILLGAYNHGKVSCINKYVNRYKQVILSGYFLIKLVLCKYFSGWLMQNHVS